MTYSEKLKDPRWQKKRLEIMQRDGFKCHSCGAEDKTLHVHHTRYSGEPWEAENRCLVTLCVDCHDLRGAFEHDLKLEFARMLADLTNENLEVLMQDFVQARSNASDCGVDRAFINGARILSAEDFECRTNIFLPVKTKETSP